jgi:hypothetical protein
MQFSAGRENTVRAINQRWLLKFWKRNLGTRNVPQWQSVYGSTDCRGKHLDEIIPAARYAEAQQPYRQTVHSGNPVYTIHDMIDSNGRLVNYERLLLPFAQDGKAIDRILASFEFFCADGAFDGCKLMTRQAGPSALRLSATIERGTIL